MGTLRSLLFNIAFFGWTALLCILGIPLLFAPAGWILVVQQFWGKGAVWLLRLLVGMDYAVSGRENLPDGPFVVAAKHQSAWDTIIFFVLLDRPAYVLKKELLAIPLYGLYARRAGHIAVDRKAGAMALRALLEDSRRAVADGMVPVIFPQGTRTAPGTRLPYQPGVAALYKGLELPVVPVALNSGLFWGRRAFRKRPGTIRLEFLPAIPPGKDRASFMAELESSIEQATDRLSAEGLSPKA